MKLFGDKLKARITSPPREGRNSVVGLKDSIISSSRGSGNKAQLGIPG